MLSYLQKFNDLPKEIKGKVSSPDVMKTISDIEKKYNINLATVVMRIMVKDISIVDLAKYFVFEHELDGRISRELVEELKSNVFYDVADYLGFVADNKPALASTLHEDKNSSRKEETDNKPLDKWIEAKKAETTVRGSNFFFSPEDEEEVKTLAKKVESYVKGNDKHEENEEKIERIIVEKNIHFSSEEVNKRFKQVLNTFIRGVRNRIDTLHTLTKPVETGGIGLVEEDADSILMAVSSLKDESIQKIGFNKEEIKKSGEKEKPTVENLKSSGVRDFDYDFSKLSSVNKEKNNNIAQEKSELLKEDDSKTEKKTSQELGLKEEKPVEDLIKIDATPGDSILGEKQSPEQGSIAGDQKEMVLDLNLDKSKDNKKEEHKNEKEGKLKLKLEPLGSFSEINKETKSQEVNRQENKGFMPETISLDSHKQEDNKDILEKERDNKISDQEEENIISIKRSSRVVDQLVQPGKVKMEDVKYVPKLTGPIDELREMDLTSFRRLGRDFNSSLANIKEKINFLEEDGYSQKLAGVKAWRQSPLNKLYLKIGNESISKNKPINVIIKERKLSEKEYLSNEEFTAIMDLNKSLRF